MQNNLLFLCKKYYNIILRRNIKLVTDKYTIREMNERLVLEQIIKNGPISRASIASTIGLNKATISAITKNLLMNL